jgi:hypothetical protein
VVLDHGALTRRNRAILEHDEEGRPKCAIAPEIEPLNQLARQVGLEYWGISSTVATLSNSYTYDCPAIRPEIELAALKAPLLTFDHLLQHDSERFTRSEALVPLRDIILRAVTDGRIDPPTWHRYSLGLQYDRLAMYEEMRKQIPLPKTPFEHLLLVAGNHPARCIDIVWVILGFDPFGFRLTSDWRGGSFGFGVVNGVLKNSGVSEAVPLVPPDELLFHPTELRSCLENSGSNQLVPDVQEIISRRSAALKEAEYLVDMQASEHLCYNLIQSALCDPDHERSVGTQILKRLQSWYRHASNTIALNETIQAFERNSRGVTEAMLEEQVNDESAMNVNWPVCVSIYRACLAELRKQFGLPQDPFVHHVRVSTPNH